VLLLLLLLPRIAGQLDPQRERVRESAVQDFFQKLGSPVKQHPGAIIANLVEEFCHACCPPAGGPMQCPVECLDGHLTLLDVGR